MMTSAELRQAFLDFFHQRGHEIVPSSPLVPANDPTLLFTNSGMVQFKDVFLGRDPRSYQRATTSQRCVRAGGKHNDLENVGYTARHHTFFEMLGNFSFGDYFKADAIRYAWEFLTDTLGLPPERLWVSVYLTDDEAYRIWAEDIGVPPERISRIGDKPDGGSDNFWQMGDTGPCGPCSEIFYDHGAHIPGGPPGSPDEDGDRYIEIWNLVFMQYDRAADGQLTPLPKPSVDTGMGLERLAAVLQEVHSNYDIDVFQNLMRAAAELTQCHDPDSSSLKVLADHIRSTAFLITDGVIPGNEGRGYVLRRIMRRAIRHGYKLGTREPFFHKLVAPLVTDMGAAYPELRESAERVTQLIAREEDRFAETLEHGMHLLERDIAQLSGREIAGETVFRLYDTYGFPVDLTADIAREQGLTVDLAGFEQAMAQQRQRARAASQFSSTQEASVSVALDDLPAIEFSGYSQLTDQAQVLALLRDQQRVERLAAGESGIVILDRSPFYAESGGQVGDQGRLFSAKAQFAVHDTRKHPPTHLHLGKLLEGEIAVGDTLNAEVDAARRQTTVQHHSATHLLHAALRQILGKHVQQKGSLVAPERLRFDFSHHAPLTDDELMRIEHLVNAEIRRNAEADIRHMGYHEALDHGAMALFGEKYGDVVRVLTFGEFSIELCGGTHVRRTGDIGLFKITTETGVAAGVRRIEAVVGEAAMARVDELEQRLGRVAQLLKANPEQSEEKIRQVLERQRRLEKEVAQLQQRLTSGQSQDLTAQAVTVETLKVLATRIDGADAKALRQTMDQLKDQLKSAAIVLASVDNGKVRLVAGVTRDQTERLSAGDLVNAVAVQVGGRGGGRADLAQAGGNQAEHLDAALRSVPQWVAAQLAAMTA